MRVRGRRLKAVFYFYETIFCGFAAGLILGDGGSDVGGNIGLAAVFVLVSVYCLYRGLLLMDHE